MTTLLNSYIGTLKATNKKVESPPQSCSMCFNDNGECTQLTVGYVMDKQLGNTGGLGGVYGILYAIGYGTFLFISIWANRLTTCFVYLVQDCRFPKRSPGRRAFSTQRSRRSAVSRRSCRSSSRASADRTDSPFVVYMLGGARGRHSQFKRICSLYHE
jgi:hypothetical protein